MWRMCFFSFVLLTFVPVPKAVQAVVLRASAENPPAFLPDYTDALLFFEKNEPKIALGCARYGINPREAIAIVAPEAYRYERFRDWVETTGLALLYVQGGPEAADFSIGHFQMKPSFVESLEAALAALPTFAARFAHLLPEENQSLRATRKARLRSLEDLDQQTEYLCAFWLLMLERFPQLAAQTEEERIAFIATAYNLGLQADESAILAWKSVRAFPYGRKFRAAQCSYAEAAVHFFRQ